ncbi:hypothetical protein [Dyella silvatica]|uniref:hypothetical protein n=1 Tax=Dyella silvatica TaxID=2992128 RepID=UPI00225643BF|nr:hypothetical protein [Dyella silvatica]
MQIQVTLLGGPADLQRHSIDSQLSRYQVAVLDNPAIYHAPFADYTAVVNTHTYMIRQVDRDVFVGIWQRRWS